MTVPTKNQSANVSDEIKAKAAETGSASDPKRKEGNTRLPNAQRDYATSERNGTSDRFWHTGPKSVSDFYLGMQNAIKENKPFSTLYNQRDGGNLKVKDHLNGIGTDNEIESANKNLQNKLEVYKNATKNSGSGNWADVCEPMAKVLDAYLELRQAQGYPDTMAGRFGGLFMAPVENVVSDAAGFLGDVADFISAITPSFSQRDNAPLEQEVSPRSYARM